MDNITLIDTPELRVVYSNMISKYMIHIKDHSRVVANLEQVDAIEPEIKEGEVINFDNGLKGIVVKDSSMDSVRIEFGVNEECEECRTKLIDFISNLGKGDL